MRGHAACARAHEPAQSEGPELELADIVRKFRPAYAQKHILTVTERAVLDAVERCRTAVLGGHVDVCLECGASRPSYNSCHDRHCPKCPAVAQAKWIAGRLERVLPTHYFHVVFTLPAELRGLARSNRALVYDLMFRSAAETLLALGRDPKRLGGEIGVTAVLHTWARDLSYHPHLHLVVTGGALSADGDRWLAARSQYLFPVKVMAALFRGKLLGALRRSEHRGELRVCDAARFAALAAHLYGKDWHVYSKRPFGGPEQVIRYLGQYTHRIAISNHRLVALDERGVTFRTKDRKLVTLDGDLFLGRWLTHVLPHGFVKIRHFGLLSAAHATTRLELARQLLAPAEATPDDGPADDSQTGGRVSTWRELVQTLIGVDLGACPACGSHALERTPLPRASNARAPPKKAA